MTSSPTLPVSAGWRGALVGGLLLAGLAITAYGAFASQLFLQSLWLPTDLASLGWLALLAVGMCALVALAPPNRTLQFGTAGATIILAVGFGPQAILAVAVILAASLCAGDLVLGGRHQKVDSPQATPLALTIGLAIIVLAMCLAAPFPINSAPVHFVCLGALVALNPGAITRHWLRLSDRVGRRSLPVLLAALLLIFVLLVYAVHAALPERYFDALAMHLFIASTVEARGYWPFNPRQYVWSVAAMGGDWAFTVAYLLGREAAAKLLNFVFLLLTCWLVYATLRERIAATAALVFTLLFATIPVTLIVVTSLFVELPLALFVTAAFVGYQHLHREMDARATLVVMLLAAAAVATKLHGVVFAVPLGLLVIYSALRSGPSIGSLLSFVFATALGLAPYALAFLKTRNPVFPYFDWIFPSPVPSLGYGAYPGGLRWDLLYSMTFNSSKHMEAAPGVLGLQFLAFGAAGVAATLLQRRFAAVVALALSTIFIVVLCLNTQYIRYLYAVFPLVIIVLAEAYAAIADRAAWLRGTALAAIALVAGSNFYLSPTAGWILKGVPLGAVLSREKREQVMQEQVNQRTMIDAINLAAGRHARVAFFGAPFAAGLQGEAVFANWYTPEFMTALNKAQTPQDIREVFSNFRITHILLTVNPSEPIQNKIVDLVQDNATPIRESRFAHLYEVDPAVTFPTELVTNGRFRDGSASWAMPDGLLSNGVVALSQGKSLSQSARQVSGGKRLRYEVKINCPGIGAALGVQINWSGHGQFLGPSSELYSCVVAGPLTIAGFVESPKLAQTADLIIAQIGGEPLQLSAVSLRAEAGVQ